MEQQNQSKKNFFENVNFNEITRDRIIDLFNAFQDFLISTNFLNEKNVNLDLVKKINKRKKRFDFNSDSFKHIYTRVVFPEDLNPAGTVFGGKLLAWVDIAGAIAMNTLYCIQDYITVEMQDVYFRSSPKSGDIINFYFQPLEIKKTSVWMRIVALNCSLAPHEAVIDCEIRFTSRNQLLISKTSQK